MKDSIDLLPRTASALDGVVGYVGQVNVNYESLAWLWFVGQHLPDAERHFPHGKWATLQRIEAQLRQIAEHAAAEHMAVLEGRHSAGMKRGDGNGA